MNEFKKNVLGVLLIVALATVILVVAMQNFSNETIAEFQGIQGTQASGFTDLLNVGRNIQSNQVVMFNTLLSADQNLLNAIVVLQNQNLCGRNQFIPDQNVIQNEIPKGVIYRCFAAQGGN